MDPGGQVGRTLTNIMTCGWMVTQPAAGLVPVSFLVSDQLAESSLFGERNKMVAGKRLLLIVSHHQCDTSAQRCLMCT